MHDNAVTISVSISRNALARLSDKARETGEDAASYAGRLVERCMELPSESDFLNSPLAEDFRRSGMTEHDLSELLEREKHAMRAQRRTCAE